MTPHLQRVTAVLWAADLPLRYPHTAGAVTALSSAGTGTDVPDHFRKVCATSRYLCRVVGDPGGQPRDERAR